MGSNTFLGDNMIHTDEDDEFDRIERENAMKGQPYHFDIFVSPSQRNQVLEEVAAKVDIALLGADLELRNRILKAIRKMKT
jgi:hypothetical protein